MELHSPVIRKKIWNFIRIAFFMMRKGLISKRKLIMDVHLMIKRGKLLGKNLGKNLLFHNHHHHHQNSRNAPLGGGFGPQEYEFSCSNSPYPVLSNTGGSGAKRKHHYFPCINAGVYDSEEIIGTQRPVIMLPNIEYSQQWSSDIVPGEKLTPLPSPFSVRVSNYSAEDENDNSSRRVDDEAEAFIRRFYEHLRAQSPVALLEYQEEYQDMFAELASFN